MNSFLPTTVPAAELELARSMGRVTARYAAYPPLSAFRAEYPEYGDRPYAALLSRPDAGQTARALALYVHMPFCYTACAFCSCTKIVTRDGGKAARYLDFLERDIVAQAAIAGEQRAVARMYWGGGTPTYYTLSQLHRVWRTLRAHFAFPDGGEHTIEIDPRTVNQAAIAELRNMGFTIASLGIPDLAEPVLEAVNRPQRPEQSLDAIAAARRAGFSAVGVELMYGLPRQTAASFIRTVSAILAAQPDRVLFHDYVHAPRRHKAQRQVSFHELPRASERVEMLGLAAEYLASAGYVHAGTDCFVRQGDALLAARDAQRLHYDVLGYSAAGETDIVPVGVSAVGATPYAYSQNESDLGAYYDRLNANAAPVARGLVLSPDDIVRRMVMRLLLCHAQVPYAAVEAQYSLPFERYFRDEMRALERYEAAGLVRFEGRALVLEPRGRLWVRNICAVFDRYQDPRRETRARAGSSF